MAASLVVTAVKGGSRITLVGTSGTELLTSKVFTEPRAKGATLRSLKALLGEGVVVDDQTVTTVRRTAPAPAPAAEPAPVAAPRPRRAAAAAAKPRPKGRTVSAKVTPAPARKRRTAAK